MARLFFASLDLDRLIDYICPRETRTYLGGSYWDFFWSYHCIRRLEN